MLVDGVVVGTWAKRRTGGRDRVSVQRFAPLESEIRDAISGEVDDIARFEGRPATLATP